MDFNTKYIPRIPRYILGIEIHARHILGIYLVYKSIPGLSLVCPLFFDTKDFSFFKILFLTKSILCLIKDTKGDPLNNKGY